jgi:glycine oxidase
MLAPGGELEEPSGLAAMTLNSLALYPGFVAELCEVSGISIDYQRCGALELALTEDEAEVLEKRAAIQAAMGIRSEIVTYSGSVSARLFPDDQLVAPREVTGALRIACLRAGVVIREHEPVTGIKPDGTGLYTTQGEYRDDSVLIAAGAWSSGLRANLPATVPVRGHLVAYHTQCAMITSILRHRGTYLLQRAGGALIAGSSSEYVGFDRTIDERIVSEIHARACALLPALQPLTPVERWNGFRPGIEGGAPAIGKIEDTAIWTAYGHYRNGILLAPETARIIVESVEAPCAP